MQTSHLIFLLLFLSAWTISCYPSKPLNERSTELTWQAWLLIDETQNKQQDSTHRRRITPKSVFIAPTFSPENLPECSEGYQSDSMGRCIKIIMLNKELHLDFLLQQLNQKFGGMEDYDDDDGATSGPLNINIPLNTQEETDVAIVVAPTNGLQIQPGMQPFNKTLVREKMNVDDIAGILGLKQAAEVETTTITGTSTANFDGTTQESTTKNFETTTINNGGVTSEFNALFFLDPKRQIEVKTDQHSDTTLLSTNLNAETTVTEIMATSTEVKREVTNERYTERPLFQMDQALPYADSHTPFLDVKREAVKPIEANIGTTASTVTKFSTIPASVMPETKYNFAHRHNLPSDSVRLKEATTTTSIVLTPIDNSLSNQDSTQVPLSSTSSIFSFGFHKPDYGTLYNSNNMKFLTRFSESFSPSVKRTTEYTTEPLSTTTEDINTTTTEEEEEVIFTKSTSTTEIETSPTETLSSTLSSDRNNEQGHIQTSQFVRFPTVEMPSTTQQVTISFDHALDASKQFEAIFKQYANTRVADVTENQRHIIKNNQSVNPTHVDLSQTLYERYKAHRDNHRNREKHTEWFHLPPKWSDTSQKPVVLRFSRKHGYIDTQQLGSNNFYREINPRMFGFPVKSRVHR